MRKRLIDFHTHTRTSICALLATGAMHCAVAQYVPDPMYGVNGLVITDVADSLDGITDSAMQADGRLTVAGHARDSICMHFSIARYMIDGQLDTTFSGDGLFMSNMGPYDHFAQAIALQVDGKILVCGLEASPDPFYLLLLRLMPNGDLDSAFGAGGMVRVDSACSAAWGNDVEVLPDGRILVIGRTDCGPSTVFLHALLPNGSHDTTFGTNGKVVVHQPVQAIMAEMAVQPDGRIVVACTQDAPLSSDLMVKRYLTDGTPDSTFASAGVFTYDMALEDHGRDVAVRSDGSIVVAFDHIAGLPDACSSVICLTPDGSVNTMFGSNGLALITVPGNSLYTWRLRVDPMDRVIGAGSHGASNTRMVAYRLQANGIPDQSFATNGIYSYDFGAPAYGEAFSVESDPSGRVLMAGYQVPDFNGYEQDCAVVGLRTNPVELVNEHVTDTGRQLQIHPNPTAQELRISFDRSILALTVLDARGSTVRSFKGSARVLQLNDLEPGTYWLRAITPRGVIVEPFVKE